MFDKLEEVELRFEKIAMQLQDPSISNNQKEYRQLMKEYSSLETVVLAFRRYKKNQQELENSKELLDNEKEEELRSLAKEEISFLEEEAEGLQNQLQLALLPKDPNDERNVIIEIRPGAGGDEASLFVQELFTAYIQYSKSQSWRAEVLSTTGGNAGGFKEVIAMISGDKVYSKLKYESGVHRVQRVPKTETQGRVHTSTVTVAVLPEADEVDVSLDMNDIRVDVFRASGSGGQHVNTTDSAVRLTHIPTGLVVSCQDEKSQYKNKEKALKVLYARILDIEKNKAEKEASEQRLGQIGTGDRSERIRTYNYPQARITDHRIGFTTHALSQIIAGDMAQLIDPVITYFQAEALKTQGI